MEKKEPVKLISVANKIEAEMIIGLLKNNDIPCLKKDNFTGSYMGIFMGYSIFGEDLYVNEKDYDKAKEILDSLGNEDDVTEDDVTQENMTIVEDTESSKNQEIAFYKKPSVVAKIIIAAVVISYLIIYSTQFWD